MTQQTLKNRSGESGNVLFLILIAVALFAALSYAVTQSTRSGPGSTEGETNLVNSASLTQYPASLRTSVIRMILNGNGAEEIYFNQPSEFGTTDEQSVFHPTGGGAVFQSAPDNTTVVGSGEWFFNGNYFVPQIGTDTGGSENDVIAFLPGISSGICSSINDEIGLTSLTTDADTDGIPEVAVTSALLLDSHINTGTPDTFPAATELDSAGDDLEGIAMACFEDTDNDVNVSLGGGASPAHVFFAVILER